ncbi:MAG: extracellular solute-binding protein [Desulfobacterales bacterium]|nr:extracellular solute-binding protein [Desulfobacterales bacterium]
MKAMTRLWFSIIVCSAILSNPAPALQADPLDPYIAGARKEGSVTIGITVRDKIHGKPAGQLYMAAFQKRYPFLKVNFKRIGGGRERERVITEMTAGVFNFDVATASATMVRTLVEARLPRAVEWGNVGVPQFLIHPKNIGMTLRTALFGIAYNRDLVPDEVAAGFTWETCTDPKWKGKIATDNLPLHLEPLYVSNVWGPEKTLDYARRAAAIKPIVESSRTSAAAKLTSGAYHLICGAPRAQTRALQVFAGSKSIGIVFPEPVPIGIGDFIFVPDKAKHPNAAVLFMVWTATQEAQNLLDRIDFSGHPAFEGNEIKELLKGKQLVYGSWDDVERSDFVLAELLQAMGMPVVRSTAKKKK